MSQIPEWLKKNPNNTDFSDLLSYKNKNKLLAREKDIELIIKQYLENKYKFEEYYYYSPYGIPENLYSLSYSIHTDRLKDNFDDSKYLNGILIILNDMNCEQYNLLV